MEPTGIRVSSGCRRAGKGWEPEGGTTEILNGDEMREMAVEALKVFARP